MRGFIGTDAILTPGLVIVTRHNREIKLTVIGLTTEERVRESAEAMGQPLVVVPGELFYEVEFETASVGSSN